MEERRTQKAIRECGQWIAQCLRLGWSRDQLDALDALWWEHHDERGNLKPPESVFKKCAQCRWPSMCSGTRHCHALAVQQGSGLQPYVSPEGRA